MSHRHLSLRHSLHPALHPALRPAAFAIATSALAIGFALTSLQAPSAHARVGFGDPAKAFRDRDPEADFVFAVQGRTRIGLFSNLDLDRGLSPNSGLPLWPTLGGENSEGPLDLTFGTDQRVRIAPSFFLDENVRLFAEVNLFDNIALGASPKGTPFDGRPGLVWATAFQDPLNFADGAIEVRSAGVEVLTPFGVLSAGRLPSHFGLGIATNAGDAIDDDGGDRADRIAFVSPILGHFAAVAYDFAAAGAGGLPAFGSPDAGAITDAVQGVSAALLRFHAPWEVELNRRANRLVFDYGVAASAQWQLSDVPSVYQLGNDALAKSPIGRQLATDPTSLRVNRDSYAVLIDAWARVNWGPLRIEAEAVATHLYTGNTSPWPGVQVREPVTGNPFGAVLLAEYTPFGASPGRGDDALFGHDASAAVQSNPTDFAPLSVLVELGVASSDPGYGFPLDGAPTSIGTGPGDVKGPQIDGPRDSRMDAYRFHPTYRVDLILWRTLLGGVSEAGYARAKVKGRPIDDLLLEANLVYSHALHADSTPGGVAPLGVELDLGATLNWGAFSLRADYGALLPFGGLGARGGAAPGIAQMLLVRLGYAS